MSDVREQLANLLLAGKSTQETVYDILERFEVTPKPVVVPNELGRMAKSAVLDSRGRPESDCDAGRRMLDRLDAAGLKLVRVDE